MVGGGAGHARYQSVEWAVNPPPSVAPPMITYQALPAPDQGPTSADSNPIEEGSQPWTLFRDGTGVLGAADTADGLPVWRQYTRGHPAREEFWLSAPSPTDAARGRAHGWTLSTKLKLPVAHDPPNEPSFGPGAVGVQYADGQKTWHMRLGTNSGTIVVQLMSSDSGGPLVPLTGLDAGVFHTYALRYDPASDTVDLLVDDNQRYSDFTGASATALIPSNYGIGKRRVAFGDMAGAADGDVLYHFVDWRVGAGELQSPTNYCVGKPGAPCADGNTCTTQDTCNSAGVCVGILVNNPVCSGVPPIETTPAQEPAVGAAFNGVLRGELTVGPSGAAIHTVPIAIPPGIAGMAPNLSLVYNSQGGNGIAGQGWELAGLSSIHRCPKTRLQDGQAQPVDLDFESGGPEDAICLDGQRLFKYDGSTSDERYFVESEQFSKIRPLSGSGPSADEFEVVTKAGETRTYGKRADARVTYSPVAGQEATVMWLLSRVKDKWGNYFDLHYNHDQGHQPGSENFVSEGVTVTSIDYTGHVGTAASPPIGAEPAQAPFWRLVFDYQHREDVRSVRFGAVSIPKKKRLAIIKIVNPAAPSQEFGTYTLTYENPDLTHMLPSRLKSVGYCAAGSDCLKALEFDWIGGGYEWPTSPSTGWALPGRIDRRGPGKSWGTQLVDLNVDGRVEFVSARPGAEFVQTTGMFGFASAPATWNLPERLVKDDGTANLSLLADLDNDGDPDQVYSSGQFNLYPFVFKNRLNETGVWATELPTSSPVVWDFTKPDHLVLDMNGDGRADLVNYRDNGVIDVYWRTSNGWQASTISYDVPFGVGSQRSCLLRDINRDGLPDAMCTDGAVGFNVGREGLNGNGTGSAWRFINTGNSLEFAPREARLYGDVDGDGFHDAVTVYPYEGTCQMNGLVGVGNYWETDVFLAPLKPRKVSISVGYGFRNLLPTYVDALNQFLVPSSVDNVPCRSPGPPTPEQLSHRRHHLMAMGDFNADGLVDMVRNFDNGGVLSGGQLLVNTGRSWVDHDGRTTRYDTRPPTFVPAVPADGDRDGYPGDPTRAVVYIDLDGDGVTDVAETRMLEGDNVDSRAWLNRFTAPVIKNFPNGLAAKTSVQYKHVTSPSSASFYANDTTLAPGTTYLAVPLRVVTSTTADNGLSQGPLSTASYSYRSMRGSSTGRGPQGFREMTVVDQASGISITTTYAQVYPSQGELSP